MTTDSAPRIKITYATLSADNEELHAQFEAGLAPTGRTSAAITRTTSAAHGATATAPSRSARRSTATSSWAPSRAAPRPTSTRPSRRPGPRQPAWAAVPWRERVAIVKRAGDLISERLMDYSPSMAIEVGKNRIEALGEVEESADLLRYYAKTMEDNDGYDHEMGNLGDATVHTRSILRPHGVFAVISPFNFPMALATGPAGAALLGGNTVVFKPSSASPLSAVKLVKAFIDAGVPKGADQPRHGPGRDGRPDASGSPGRRWHRLHRLVRGRDAALPLVLEGVAATDASSRWVARTRRSSRARPTSRRRPRGSCAAPSGSAGRSARPTRGSTSNGRSTTSSSGCWSRRPRRSRSAIRSSAPTGWARSSTRRAVDRHQTAVAEARRDGTVFTGGEQLTDGDLARGFYVEPTVVGDLPRSHRLFRDELFAPFTAVAAVDSIDEALALANDYVLGLTAGRLQRGPGRGPAVPRQRPGRRPVRQSPRRRDDRGMAGRPGVRRLEGEWLDRQGRALDVLRRAVHARAVPHHRRLGPPRDGQRRPPASTLRSW